MLCAVRGNHWYRYGKASLAMFLLNMDLGILLITEEGTGLTEGLMASKCSVSCRMSMLQVSQLGNEAVGCDRAPCL